jgi:ATP-dependent DNA helicase RecG
MAGKRIQEFSDLEKGSEQTSEKTSERTSDETRVKTRVKILSAIRANGMITREELAQSLAMTIKGVDWQIAKMKQTGER